MPKGIKYHDDICQACKSRREVTIWRRDGAYQALLPGECAHKQECTEKLVRASGFDPVVQSETVTQ